MLIGFLIALAIFLACSIVIAVDWFNRRANEHEAARQNIRESISRHEPPPAA